MTPVANTPNQAAVAVAAQKFEAHAIGALLQPMFDTVGSGPFDGGAAEQTWKPTMVTEIANHIAASGGLGLAAPVMRQMLQLQEGAGQGAGQGTFGGARGVAR